jgi:hypothetical protein
MINEFYTQNTSMGKSMHVDTRERDEFSLDEKLGFGVSELGSIQIVLKCGFQQCWAVYFILKIKHLIIIF